MKNKMKTNQYIKQIVSGILLGVFMMLAMITTLTIYAGALNPSTSNGLSNGSPIASMLSLLDMAQTTTGTFDRTTDSLEAISNKIDNITVSNNTPTKSAFHVWKSASQSIPNATATKVNWEATKFDINNDFDFTNERFVVSQTGVYILTADLFWTAATDQSWMQAIIYKNGSNIATAAQSTTVTAISDANYNDFFEVYVYQSTSVSQNLGNAFSQTSFFGAQL